MRLRMASPKDEGFYQAQPSRLAPPSSFETQTRAGLLLRMRGGRVFPAGFWRLNFANSLRHPGLDPGSRLTSTALRSRVEPGMTDRGGRWQRAKALTPKCGPAARSRKGAAQRNLVRDPAQRFARAAARDCLKTRRKRASRGSPRAGPRTPFRCRSRVPGTCRGAALFRSGSVPHAACWNCRTGLVAPGGLGGGGKAPRSCLIAMGGVWTQWPVAW